MNPAPAAEAVDPTLLPAFSLRNRLGRALWNLCWALFYRTSPRPFHAWRALLLRLFGAKLGTGLPLLSSIEDLGALEPGLRRPRHARRRRRAVQPVTLLPGVALHHLPGRISVRGDSRVQSSRLPADLVPHESWRLCLDMRPRDRASARQRRRGSRARAGLHRHPRSGALRRLLRSTRHQDQGAPAVRRSRAISCQSKANV